MSVMPALTYDDPNAAITFLEAAFGFQPTLMVTDDAGRVQHAELAAEGGTVMLGPSGWSDWARSPRSAGGANTQTVHVAVADVDAHCARARAAGARIVAEPSDQFYGDRTYRAADPEGHHWNFGQHVRDVSAEDMRKATGLTVEYRT
ncbi:glyoxalase [Allostella sp. ATCC 35155]|nr:glyoxalase [Stella sp. ATCC 35155]